MFILGVTPARGGSKGIPGKNIKTIAGRPLLAWTIEAAKKSKRLDRYVVSTESVEISKVALQWGAEVIPRSNELAEDETSTFDVLRDIVKGIPADLVVLLQATSPIRDEGLVDECIDRFLSSSADSLATGWLCKHVAYGHAGIPRQQLDGFFYDDGNLYIFKGENILTGKPFGMIHEKVYLNKEHNIDIDDEFDFWLAEQVLRKRMNQPSTIFHA